MIPSKPKLEEVKTAPLSQKVYDFKTMDIRIKQEVTVPEMSMMTQTKTEYSDPIDSF